MFKNILKVATGTLAATGMWSANGPARLDYEVVVTKVCTPLGITDSTQCDMLDNAFASIANEVKDNIVVVDYSKGLIVIPALLNKCKEVSVLLSLVAGVNANTDLNALEALEAICNKDTTIGYRELCSTSSGCASFDDQGKSLAISTPEDIIDTFAEVWKIYGVNVERETKWDELIMSYQRIPDVRDRCLKIMNDFDEQPFQEDVTGDLEDLILTKMYKDQNCECLNYMFNRNNNRDKSWKRRLSSHMENKCSCIYLSELTKAELQNQISPKHLEKRGFWGWGAATPVEEPKKKAVKKRSVMSEFSSQCLISKDGDLSIPSRKLFRDTDTSLTYLPRAARMNTNFTSEANFPSNKTAELDKFCEENDNMFGAYECKEAVNIVETLSFFSKDLPEITDDNVLKIKDTEHSSRLYEFVALALDYDFIALWNTIGKLDSTKKTVPGTSSDITIDSQEISITDRERIRPLLKFAL
jgi:hypothetical protein